MTAKFKMFNKIGERAYVCVSASVCARECEFVCARARVCNCICMWIVHGNIAETKNESGLFGIQYPCTKICWKQTILYAWVWKCGAKNGGGQMWRIDQLRSTVNIYMWIKFVLLLYLFLIILPNKNRKPKTNISSEDREGKGKSAPHSLADNWLVAFKGRKHKIAIARKTVVFDVNKHMYIYIHMH